MCGGSEWLSESGGNLDKKQVEGDRIIIGGCKPGQLSGYTRPSSRHHQRPVDLLWKLLLRARHYPSGGIVRVTYPERPAVRSTADVERSITSTSHSVCWTSLFVKMKASKLSYPDELKHT